MKDSIKRIDPLIVIAAGKHDSAACRSQRQAMYIIAPPYIIECVMFEVVWLGDLGAAKGIDWQRARHVGKPLATCSILICKAADPTQKSPF